MSRLQQIITQQQRGEIQCFECKKKLNEIVFSLQFLLATNKPYCTYLSIYLQTTLKRQRNMNLNANGEEALVIE